VESTEVVDEDGMTVPDWEHGTTSVVKTVIVVTGTLVGTPVPVVVTLAAQVMIPGLEPIYGAQMPWK
jgi:hypothetical protein